MVNGNDNPSDPNSKSIDVSQINAATQAQVEYSNAVENSGKVTEKTGAANEELIGTLEKVKKTLSSLTTKEFDFKKMLVDFSKSTGVDISPITNMFGEMGSQMGSVFGKLVDYGGLFTGLGNEVQRDFFNPIKEGNVGILASLLPADSVFKSKLQFIRDYMQEFLDVQNTSRVGFTRWQNSVLASGTAIDQANKAASEYPNTLMVMAHAHSVSGAKLNDMMKALQGMPIILNQNSLMASDVVSVQSKMVSELGNLINASKAFGMTEEEVTQRAKSGYMDFNQSVTETISSLATMEAASKATGIDRKIADEQIVSASKSLAIFGQKSDSAAGLWTTFTSSLKDTVPIKQVGEIVSEVTAKIAGMSVQNRAFISMMSGMSQGRSAMGGALQLEVAMRTPEGMEKNLQAMTSTLSQFAGGKIITLEEAANNPQLEIQFQLQRDMLGKISGISDTQNQNRVLEVLQKVQAGGMSQVDGGKELSSIMEKGGNIQERQLNALDQLANNFRVFGIDVLKPEKQFEGAGDALLGRKQFEKSDPKTGTARLKSALKEKTPGSSVMTDNKVLKAYGLMFENLSRDFSKIIKVDFADAVEGFKKIFEFSQKGSDKDVGYLAPQLPSENTKTIDFKKLEQEKNTQTVKDLTNVKPPPPPQSVLGDPPKQLESVLGDQPKQPESVLGDPPKQSRLGYNAVPPFIPPLKEKVPIEELVSPMERAKREGNKAFATLGEVPTNERKEKSVKVQTSQGEGTSNINIAINIKSPSGDEFKKIEQNLVNGIVKIINDGQSYA